MTTQQPLVTIVIPCYNHAQFVQETINSVVNQDYKNIELIIIDDGSKDDSVEVIKNMISVCEERFVRFEFRYRENKGLCATLNEALEWCEGKYFAPIASDDILLKHKTSTQVSYFMSEGGRAVVGVFGLVSVINNQSVDIREITNTDYGKVGIYNFEQIFLRKATLLAPTAMLETEALRKVSGYDVSMKIEDFYLWLRITIDGAKLAVIDNIFSLYRRHDNNLSKNSEVMLSGVEDVLVFYKEHKLYNEALARSYLVHAGDLSENGEGGAWRLVFKGIKKSPKIVLSKLFFVFLFRFVFSYRYG